MDIEQSEAKIIFDNGGGVTLLLPGFFHYYSNPVQAAEDYKSWLETGDTSGWEGHDPEAWLQPSDDDIRNGGYLVYDSSDIREIWEFQGYENDWRNVEQFVKALGIQHPAYPFSYLDWQFDGPDGMTYFDVHFREDFGPIKRGDKFDSASHREGKLDIYNFEKKKCGNAELCGKTNLIHSINIKYVAADV